MTQLIELPSGTLVNLANVDCIMLIDEEFDIRDEEDYAFIFYNAQDDTGEPADEVTISKEDYDYLYGKFTLKYDPDWRNWRGLP